MSRTSQYRRISPVPMGLKLLACAVVLAALVAESGAEPIPLMQLPAVNMGRPPAPNVIVSIDDSGSMLFRVDAEAYADSRQRETPATRMAILRASLLQAFSENNIPNGAIRLAWMSMNGCPNIPSAIGGCNNNNGMRILDASHRKRFLDWVSGTSTGGSLKAEGGTPALRMLFNAGNYLKSNRQPWLNDPSVSNSGALACRRTYNIFMSDGGWNSQAVLPTSGQVGNYSNRLQPLQLPDGTSYDIRNPQLNIYRDRSRFPNGFIPTTGSNAWNWPTLSDLAFYFWATDLSGLGRQLEPKMVERVARPIQGASWSLEPYWNPANNVATWQHMTIYSVGFGVGANWAPLGARPVFGRDTWNGGDYDDLLSGSKRWIDPYSTTNEVLRMPELWHMAINSRGKYIPVTKAEDLAPAFRDILSEIIVDSQLPMASVALSATTTRADSLVFTASYNPATWSGYLQAQTVKAGNAAIDGNNQPWGGKNTAQIMSDQGANWFNQRKIVSAKSNGLAIDWKWSELDASQQALLNSTDKLGQNRLLYLRGDQSKELDKSGGVFRQRESIHGDVVNSQIWFMPGNHYRTATKNPNRPDMLYVGANDGMLHAFNATTGREMLAYVPKGLISQLSLLTESGYASRHRYFVDGSAFTGDVFTHQKSSDGSADTALPKSYLAGSLGAGGRGYFVLDVTAPQNFVSAQPSDVLVLDQTLDASERFEVTDPKAWIGHIMAAPVVDQVDTRFSNQLVRMNDGRWALVMGNGYNSQNEQAALLIQFLEGAKELKVIPASATEPLGSSNGLAAPRLIDLNGDGAIDIAYAGDLLGNIWKFDLSSASPSDWMPSFSGAPLFQTQRVGAGATQSRPAITTAPAFAFHPDGGIMLMFGTGRLLSNADRSSIDNEYVLAIRDAASYSSTPVLAGGVANTLGSVKLVDKSSDRVDWQDLVEIHTVLNGDSWNLSNTPVDYSSNKGWFFQLPVAGSRVLENSLWTIGEQFRVPIVLPAQGGSLEAKETCDVEFAASQYYQANLAIRTAAPVLPPAQCDANGGNCKDWLQDPLIKPDHREYRGKYLLGDRELWSPGVAEPEPLFSIMPLTPSWRPIR